jgi:FixJ family two-component response regulator
MDEAPDMPVGTAFGMDDKRIVFVVDDDQNMLRLIAAVLEREGLTAQTFSDAGEFLARYQPDQRGCLLLDVELPGLSGLDLQQELQKRSIDLPVVFLTATADVPTAVKAMKRGALDLVQKPFEIDSLIAAVRRALAHDAEISNAQSRYLQVLKRRNRLTPREFQVMELVVAGNSNKQVAARLECSPKTVEIHRGRVMRKMEAQSVADLVHQCIELSKKKAAN